MWTVWPLPQSYQAEQPGIPLQCAMCRHGMEDKENILTLRGSARYIHGRHFDFCSGGGEEELTPKIIFAIFR